MNKETEQYGTRVKLTFNSVIRSNGNFVALPSPLVEFMGLANAVFLIGLMNHYNYLRKKRRVQRGELFYDATIFKRQWDISQHKQNKAIRELSKCRLLKVIGRTYRNRKRLKINLVHCYSIVQLIYILNGNPALWPYFSFEKLQRSIKLRRSLLRWLKRMRFDWPNVRFHEYGDFSCKEFKQSVIKNLPTKRSKIPKF